LDRVQPPGVILSQGMVMVKGDHQSDLALIKYYIVIFKYFELALETPVPD